MKVFGLIADLAPGAALVLIGSVMAITALVDLIRY